MPEAKRLPVYFREIAETFNVCVKKTVTQQETLYRVVSGSTLVNDGLNMSDTYLFPV